MSTDHKIRRLDAAELARYEAHDWTTCVRHRCQGTHVYLVSHTNDLGKRVRQRVCGMHGVRFAERYRLDVPPDPAASTDARTVASPGGLSFPICPDCRHWLGRTTVAPGECVAGCRCKNGCHRQTGTEAA